MEGMQYPELNLPPLTSGSIWIYGGFSLPGCNDTTLGTTLPIDGSTSGKFFWKERSKT